MVHSYDSSLFFQNSESGTMHDEADGYEENEQNGIDVDMNDSCMGGMEAEVDGNQIEVFFS